MAVPENVTSPAVIDDPLSVMAPVDINFTAFEPALTVPTVYEPVLEKFTTPELAVAEKVPVI